MKHKYSKSPFNRMSESSKYAIMKRKFCTYSIYSSHDHSFHLLILLARLNIQIRLNMKYNKWSRDSRTGDQWSHQVVGPKCVRWWRCEEGVVSRSTFTQLRAVNTFNERTAIITFGSILKYRFAASSSVINVKLLHRFIQFECYTVVYRLVMSRVFQFFLNWSMKVRQIFS